MGAAVTQLAGPHAELVAAVYRGERAAAVQGPVSGTDIEEILGTQRALRQAQQRRHLYVGVQQSRSRQRLRRNLGIERRRQRRERIFDTQVEDGISRHGMAFGRRRAPPALTGS
jgi:hypothetical protein